MNQSHTHGAKREFTDIQRIQCFTNSAVWEVKQTEVLEGKSLK